ncbi:thioredoxin family protein [Winogradskyella sp. DF17]|uniref:Thioredoxin family protein n=1 Tax=Winogradskyella pelagia TaxID=2819984 RepID=A0ABS3SZP1_9FLAO|nr:thioredoxin family protein [Winogradskyella sp. DF17]MBO3115136.1 thioredoxin family protein [Winogradskyella sp. DF17]
MLRVFFLIATCFTVLGSAQEEKINWLTFEQLEIKLSKKPKKVMVYFYADWCVYCKKMDQSVFNKAEVKAILKMDYYAVKFNAEYKDTIYFGGKSFVNKQIGKKRNPFHDIPKLLAGRPNTPLELPATVILDEKFIIKGRYNRYISPKEMVSILKH